MFSLCLPLSFTSPKVKHLTNVAADNIYIVIALNEFFKCYFVLFAAEFLPFCNINHLNKTYFFH